MFTDAHRWLPSIKLQRCKDNGVFPKWSRTFAEFSDFRETDKSLKHELDQFKDPVSHMCLAGTVVAPWSLAQEVAGLSPFKDHCCGSMLVSYTRDGWVAGSSPFNVMIFLSLNSANI